MNFVMDITQKNFKKIKNLYFLLFSRYLDN